MTVVVHLSDSGWPAEPEQLAGLPLLSSSVRTTPPSSPAPPSSSTAGSSPAPRPSSWKGRQADGRRHYVLADWTTAERDPDISALEEKLTDDFLGVGPLGFTLPKDAWLARHRAGDLKYETFGLDDRLVRSYGDVAVVTARHTATGTYQGHPLPADLRATLVIVHQANAWRLAGIHMSFIAGTPGAPPIPGG